MVGLRCCFSTLDLGRRFDTPSKAISFLFLSSVILLRGRNVQANDWGILLTRPDDGATRQNDGVV